MTDINRMNKKEERQVDFKYFLEYFPEVELPITLTEEAARLFSSQNEPLNAETIAQHILPYYDGRIDDVTEFVPCFKVPHTDGFHAVVFWVASMMTYQFVMLTFTQHGGYIDNRILAGTIYDGQLLTQSVATIESDWLIYIVTGQSSGEQLHSYNAASSRAYDLELLPDGKIINLV